MVNKINKERRRSMNGTPTKPSNKDQRPGAQTDHKQNTKGHKAEHGQDNHLIIIITLERKYM
jgi:hypothetical protein